MVGTAVGSVPDDTPMVPLARDLASTQRRLRLKLEDRTLELDLRRPTQLARSHLLHRLTLLEVPWGQLVEGRGAAGTFRETWRLRWEPELAVRLVERSAYGTTVEAAAAAYVVQRAGEDAGLAELTRAVEGCLLADLPAALEPLMAGLAARAAVHADVPQLMDALGPLARARRYGDVRGTDGGALDTVLAGLVVRVAAGLRPACTGLGGGGGRVDGGPAPGHAVLPGAARRGRPAGHLVRRARRPRRAAGGRGDGAGPGVPPAARRRAARRGRGRAPARPRAHAGHATGRGRGVRRGLPGRQRDRARPRPRRCSGCWTSGSGGSRPRRSPTPCRCCAGRSPRSSRRSGG